MSQVTDQRLADLEDAVAELVAIAREHLSVARDTFGPTGGSWPGR